MRVLPPLIGSIALASASPPRVGVVGRGAVGLYYGCRLLEAGADVRFLMRSDLSAVRERGARVESVDGDMDFSAAEMEGRCFADAGPVDWLLVALKTTALGELPRIAAPMVGPETRVLAVMNGFGVERACRPLVGGDDSRVFGGMAFICSTRSGAGRVHHQAHGALLLGNLADDAGALSEALRLFEGSKVTVSGAPCLQKARWEKLAWNLPFNGPLTALGGLSTEAVVHNPRMRALASAIMDETLDAQEAYLREHLPHVEPLDRLATKEKMWRLTDTMGEYWPSTVLDLRAGKEIEMRYMFEEPLREAEALGVPCEHLRAVVAMISAQHAWDR